MLTEVGDFLHLPAPHQQSHTFSLETLSKLGIDNPMPGEISVDDAMFIASISIALQAIHDAKIKVGDSITIYGMGVLGQIALQLAVLNGASRIDVIDPIEKRRMLALKHGATNAYDPTVMDVELALKSEDKYQGADTAIEFSGNHLALHNAIRSVRMGGFVVAAGFYQKGATKLCLGEEWLHNKVSMVASMRRWGNTHRDFPLWDRTRLRETSISLLRDNKLNVKDMISHRFNYFDADKAYELLLNPSNDLMRIVLDY